MTLVQYRITNSKKVFRVSCNKALIDDAIEVFYCRTQLTLARNCNEEAFFRGLAITIESMEIEELLL